MVRRSRFYTEAPYLVEKTIEFDGGAGSGAVGTVSVFTITGKVLLRAIVGTCSESLVSAGGGTLVLEASDGFDLIPQTTATDLDADDLWADASPAETVGVALAATQKDIVLNGGASGATVVITVGTDDVTDGTITIHALFYPLSSDGDLEAA